MYKFPSIEQFKNVIGNVKHKTYCIGYDEQDHPIMDRNKPLPTLKFRGSVKLHGTNAGIELTKEGEILYKSRERILELTADNATFMLSMKNQEAHLKDLFNQIKEIYSLDGYLSICIYGEWCGGSIQKSVALNQLDKMYVIFGIKVIGIGDEEDLKDVWLDLTKVAHIKYEDARIYNILQFPTYEVDIDFSNPQLSQNILVDITEKVETECPVAKAFGVSGIGEGVVWQCIEQGYTSSRYWFKVKGEKHAHKHKVKTLAPVDVEALNSIAEFVQETVCENRLLQGVDKLKENNKPLDNTSIGDFVRWVYNDIVKEEMDTIVASQLDPKKLGNPISSKARIWFINYINTHE